jgi:hypothetical protein
MKTFKIVAQLGNANVVAEGKCDDVDRMISRWEGTLAEQSDPDYRDASKNFVIKALKSGEHHRDATIAQGVVLALTWLTATGEIGSAVVPYLRAGGITLLVEITNINGDTYNFRTKFDEDTSAKLAL